MASNAQSSREEQRSLSVRTLAIASVASAVAALLTSLFWTRGTPFAAAVTPLIVALVSELLHRPAEVISQRFTAETDALPEAAGAGPPPPRQAQEGEPARDDAETAVEEGTAATAALRRATRERAAAARTTQDGGNGGRPHEPATREIPPGVRVYGSGKRSLPWKPIALTAVLAFVIGAGILTLPELIAGQSLGGGDRGTTYFGGGSRADRDRDRGASDEKEPAPKPEQDREPAPPDRPDPDPEADPEAEQSPAPEAKPRPAPERETTTTPPETTQETGPEPTTPAPSGQQEQPQAP